MTDVWNQFTGGKYMKVVLGMKMISEIGAVYALSATFEI